MNIGFYNPYHRTTGGGELYLFLMMQIFSKKHTVFYYTDQPERVTEAEQRFSINLSAVTIVPPVFETGTFIEKAKETKKLNGMFWYSDGSIPMTFAQHNVLVFQYPVPWVKRTPQVSLKIKLFQRVIVNSHFTKSFIDNTFGVQSHVLYPSIQVSDYSSGSKQQTIVSVGRFTQGMNMKRQDILIDAFKAMVDAGMKDWKLLIIGGMLPEDQGFVDSLKKRIGSYPIELYVNSPRSFVLESLKHAPIYWHAAGYGVDEKKHPELTEHFGISVVEAMASGCVPFVYNSGGPKEYISNTEGFTWNSIEELIKQTTSVTTDSTLRERLSTSCTMKAAMFDRFSFEKSLFEYIPWYE